MKQLLDRFFHLTERRTDIRTEVLAGLTTFMAMAYIVLVNPQILSETGMPADALLVATCLAAAFATLLMAFFANYPFVLASGMGLNAFFAYTVVMEMGIPWQVALAAIFIEGLIFIVLTLTKIREAVVNGIPPTLKTSIAAGIGMFIAFIGFQKGGLTAGSPATLVTLAPLDGNLPALLTLGGLLVIGLLETLRVRGAIFWGIIAVTALAIPLGVAPVPAAIIAKPPSIAPIFMKMDFSAVGLNLFDPRIVNFWMIVFTFFFVDFFDTVGTLIGVSCRAGLLDEKNCLPNARQALLADAVGTTAGAVLGVSTVTTYVESAAGVGVGGRTGLTALVAALLFLAVMFFSPLVQIVPACATAPALIAVGIYMMMDIGKLDFKDWTELLPAMLSIFAMPFCYSIAAGIEVGIVSYAAVKLITGRARSVSLIIWCLAAIFILKEILL